MNTLPSEVLIRIFNLVGDCRSLSCCNKLLNDTFDSLPLQRKKLYVTLFKEYAYRGIYGIGNIKEIIRKCIKYNFKIEGQSCPMKQPLSLEDFDYYVCCIQGVPVKEEDDWEDVEIIHQGEKVYLLRRFSSNNDFYVEVVE